MSTLGWGVGVTSELMDHYLSFLNKMFNSLACFQYDIKRKEKHLFENEKGFSRRNIFVYFGYRSW